MQKFNNNLPEYYAIKCNPIFGFGLGNFMTISPKAQWQFMNLFTEYGQGNPIHRYEHAHNDYVEYFYETGYIGFLIMAWLLADFFYKFYVSHKSKLLTTSFLCVLAQLISATGIYTVHTIISAMMLVIFLGVFYGEANGQIR
jgi:O-antigen ligase